jgi:hypothetical protein
MPTDLLGPFGLLVALSAGLAVLWREHLNADKDDRDQRDLAQHHLGLSLQNNADAIAAWNRRTELDAARARRTDRTKP